MTFPNDRWRLAYKEHYLRYLGYHESMMEYQVAGLQSVIEVMTYNNQAENCLAFCTAGIADQVILRQLPLELITQLHLQCDLECIPQLLMKVATYIIDNQWVIHPCTSLGSLERIEPDFVAQYQKNALYFTIGPFTPEYFNIFQDHGETAYAYNCSFISDSERQYLLMHGPDKFEDLLVEHDTDIMLLDRDSCL